MSAPVWFQAHLLLAGTRVTKSKRALGGISAGGGAVGRMDREGVCGDQSGDVFLSECAGISQGLERMQVLHVDVGNAGKM